MGEDMTLNSFDSVFYTLSFIVPGFILQSILSVFVPRKSVPTQISFIRFLTLSCFNYAFCSWLIYLIFQSEVFLTHPIRTALAWAYIILLSPILLGLISGYFSQKEFIRKIFFSIGLNPIHVIPTAWDYKFSNIKEAVWLLVTLKDGSTVAGLFGAKSFASSETDERDLYIQDVFRIPDKGQWERVTNNAGIWVKGDQIKHIEFWDD